MFPVRIEAVGWVTGLHGTGSDPEPSPQRAVLVEEMQRRGVDNPNTLLASRNASMVLLRAVLRPGIQKGDHFDVEVRTPGRSETTSLRGGYLLETRLAELAVLGDGMIHNGRERGVAQGPILVDPTGDPKSEQDRSALCRGRILGGGISFVTRELGLIMTDEHRDVVVASRVAAAVNKRFFSYQKGIQVGVAKAHTDQWVELAVHPHYKDNLERYIQVVRAIAVQETPAQQVQRIIDLERKLFSPDDRGAGGRAVGSHRPARHGHVDEGDAVERPRGAVLFGRGAGLPGAPRGGGVAEPGRPRRTGLPRGGLDRPGGPGRPGRRRAAPQLADGGQRGNPLRRLPRPLDRQPQRPRHSAANSSAASSATTCWTSPARR